jgi:hypothetical protein
MCQLCPDPSCHWVQRLALGGADLPAGGEVAALEFVMRGIEVGGLLDRRARRRPRQAKTEAIALDAFVRLFAGRGNWTP